MVVVAPWPWRYQRPEDAPEVLIQSVRPVVLAGEEVGLPLVGVQPARGGVQQPLCLFDHELAGVIEAHAVFVVLLPKGKRQSASRGQRPPDPPARTDGPRVPTCRHDTRPATRIGGLFFLFSLRRDWRICRDPGLRPRPHRRRAPVRRSGHRGGDGFHDTRAAGIRGGGRPLRESPRFAGALLRHRVDDAGVMVGGAGTRYPLHVCAISSHIIDDEHRTQGTSKAL